MGDGIETSTKKIQDIGLIKTTLAPKFIKSTNTTEELQSKSVEKKFQEQRRRTAIKKLLDYEDETKESDDDSTTKLDDISPVLALFQSLIKSDIRNQARGQNEGIL